MRIKVLIMTALLVAASNTKCIFTRYGNKENSNAARVKGAYCRPV